MLLGTSGCLSSMGLKSTENRLAFLITVGTLSQSGDPCLHRCKGSFRRTVFWFSVDVFSWQSSEMSAFTDVKYMSQPEILSL